MDFKQYLPVSKKELKKAIEEAYNKGTADERVWSNARIDNLKNEMEFSENRSDSWGEMYTQYGFLGQNEQREGDKNIPDALQIKESEKKIWKAEGYFGAAETTLFNSREQPESDLTAAQDAAYSATFLDPHFNALITNLTNYVIGGGVKIAVSNKRLQDFIDDSLRHNEFGLFQRDIVLKTIQMGEFWLGMFTENNGTVNLTEYQTYEITDVETAKDNRRKYLAYQYTPPDFNYKEDWIADYRYFDQKTDEVNYTKSINHDKLTNDKVIMFVKYNKGSEVRGRVPFGGSLKYFRMARDFLFDRFILNHERNRVIWLKKISRRTPESREIQKPVGFMSGTNFPFGKVIQIQTDEDIQAISAKIDGGDAKPDYLNILYMACADGQAPLIVVDQRASEEVYASMKRSSNPFHQSIIAWRTFFGYYFTNIIRYMIIQGVKYGKLREYGLGKTTTLKKENYPFLEFENKKDVRMSIEDIPINVIFPDVFTEDPLNQARADALMLDRNVISRETVATRQGLNYSDEMSKMDKVKQMPTDKKDKDQGKPSKVGLPSRVGVSEEELDIRITLENLEQRIEGVERINAE